MSAVSSNNPYVFPFENDPDDPHGMTLRDWFAGQVLCRTTIQNADGLSDAEKHAFWAETAYAVADAMLAERGKT